MGMGTIYRKSGNYPKKNLYATVFQTDDEAAELWEDVTDIQTETYSSI